MKNLAFYEYSLFFPNLFMCALTEFLREEVVVLLTAQFITLFNQTALEVMHPLQIDQIKTWSGKLLLKAIFHFL